MTLKDKSKRKKEGRKKGAEKIKLELRKERNVE